MNIQLSERFIRFAKTECHQSSDLYEQLSLAIAQDAQLLQLSSFAGAGQPVPNLLFGAVHYLLLKGKSHTLSSYYASLVENPARVEEAFSSFKAFCLENQEEIKNILTTRLVQTNEVRRCGYLYPVFCYIQEMTKKPIALIEIGTSAGLQLLFDHYQYTYGTEECYGKLDSVVKIATEVKGDNRPMLMKNAPLISTRMGIDLNVLDLKKEDDELWLQALIWPEHHKRRELLHAASEYVKSSSLTLIEGNGVELLPNLANTIDEDSVICVFHTHVANQMPLEQKKQLLEEIATLGGRRTIFHLYNNIQDRNLHLDYYINGVEYKQTIGATDGHGSWFEWKLI
ncbi:DUF2332 domain-containing protein [Caldibacillus lycopersici]|uniref:DUF2332 domain-containing protein n=1 Tax=Perspicuibacillus lycopersici TaxID=1325689 RepID=A0AAE3IWD6_9BACI|nr:DUF2332 domain-containing protein [Perspicuibacillus lycopersici]MCU9614616.1 DUF2332 domain-containing protein [Perspicuibacillus lycopersici]